MRKVIVFVALFALIAATAFGAAFAPTAMKISAPSYVKYDFDGKNLAIPVTLTGTGRNVTSLVSRRIRVPRSAHSANGYLGWHYVNKIDTCVYLGQAVAFSKGSNHGQRTGKGDGGTAVPKGTYTYYLWGYDNVSPKTQMTAQLTRVGRPRHDL